MVDTERRSSEEKQAKSATVVWTEQDEQAQCRNCLTSQLLSNCVCDLHDRVDVDVQSFANVLAKICPKAGANGEKPANHFVNQAM